MLNRMIFMLLFPGLAETAVAGGIGIYYPTTIPVKSMEKAIRTDQAGTGFDLTVFAKFSEFKSTNKNNPFEIKIVPSSFISYDLEKDCVPVLQFVNNNQTEFQYSLLSLNGTWTKDNLSDGTLGLVDELGRQELKTFVEAITGSKFKNIKTVSKVEDLFNMLSLGNADFILISPENLEVEKRKFVAQTHEILKTKKVKYPVVCAKNDKHKDVDSLRKLAGETVRALGFTGIKDF